MGDLRCTSKGPPIGTNRTGKSWREVVDQSEFVIFFVARRIVSGTGYVVGRWVGVIGYKLVMKWWWMLKLRCGKRRNCM